jgi:hypothetical protein
MSDSLNLLLVRQVWVGTGDMYYITTKTGELLAKLKP